METTGIIGVILLVYRVYVRNYANNLAESTRKVSAAGKSGYGLQR